MTISFKFWPGLGLLLFDGLQSVYYGLFHFPKDYYSAFYYRYVIFLLHLWNGRYVVEDFIHYFNDYVRLDGSGKHILFNLTVLIHVLIEFILNIWAFLFFDQNRRKLVRHWNKYQPLHNCHVKNNNCVVIIFYRSVLIQF